MTTTVTLTRTYTDTFVPGVYGQVVKEYAVKLTHRVPAIVRTFETQDGVMTGSACCLCGLRQCEHVAALVDNIELVKHN